MVWVEASQLSGVGNLAHLTHLGHVPISSMESVSHTKSTPAIDMQLITPHKHCIKALKLSKSTISTKGPYSTSIAPL